MTDARLVLSEEFFWTSDSKSVGKTDKSAVEAFRNAGTTFCKGTPS
jgi:hypothetical protein